MAGDACRMKQIRPLHTAHLSPTARKPFLGGAGLPTPRSMSRSSHV